MNHIKIFENFDSNIPKLPTEEEITEICGDFSDMGFEKKIKYNFFNRWSGDLELKTWQDIYKKFNGDNNCVIHFTCTWKESYNITNKMIEDEFNEFKNKLKFLYNYDILCDLVIENCHYQNSLWRPEGFRIILRPRKHRKTDLHF